MQSGPTTSPTTNSFLPGAASLAKADEPDGEASLLLPRRRGQECTSSDSVIFIVIRMLRYREDPKGRNEKPRGIREGPRTAVDPRTCSHSRPRTGFTIRGYLENASWRVIVAESRGYSKAMTADPSLGSRGVCPAATQRVTTPRGDRRRIEQEATPESSGSCGLDHGKRSRHSQGQPWPRQSRVQKRGSRHSDRPSHDNSLPR